MPNFNVSDEHGNVLVAGHLGADPVMSIPLGGGRVSRFSIATNFIENEGKKVLWHSIEVWNELAEMASTFKKGQAIVVIGRHRIDTHKGKTYTKLVGKVMMPWPKFTKEQPPTSNPGRHESLPKREPGDEETESFPF